VTYLQYRNILNQWLVAQGGAKSNKDEERHMGPTRDFLRKLGLVTGICLLLAACQSQPKGVGTAPTPFDGVWKGVSEMVEIGNCGDVGSVSDMTITITNGIIDSVQLPAYGTFLIDGYVDSSGLFFGKITNEEAHAEYSGAAHDNAISGEWSEFKGGCTGKFNLKRS
jgi:hypothetical protein